MNGHQSSYATLSMYVIPNTVESHGDIWTLLNITITVRLYLAVTIAIANNVSNRRFTGSLIFWKGSNSPWDHIFMLGICINDDFTSKHQVVQLSIRYAPQITLTILLSKRILCQFQCLHCVLLKAISYVYNRSGVFSKRRRSAFCEIFQITRLAWTVLFFCVTRTNKI